MSFIPSLLRVLTGAIVLLGVSLTGLSNDAEALTARQTCLQDCRNGCGQKYASPADQKKCGAHCSSECAVGSESGRKITKGKETNRDENTKGKELNRDENTKGKETNRDENTKGKETNRDENTKGKETNRD